MSIALACKGCPPSSEDTPAYPVELRTHEALRYFERNFLPIGMRLTDWDRSVVSDIIGDALKTVTPAKIRTVGELVQVLKSSGCRKARQVSEAYLAAKADMEKYAPDSTVNIDALTIDSLCAAREKRLAAKRPHPMYQYMHEGWNACKAAISLFTVSVRMILRPAAVAAVGLATVIEWPVIKVLFESTDPAVLATQLRAAQVVAGGRWEVLNREFHVPEVLQYFLWIMFTLALVLNAFRLTRSAQT